MNERRQAPTAGDSLGLIASTSDEILRTLMQLVDCNARLEGRMEKLETLANSAWEVGKSAVEMHKDTRGVIDTHIAESAQFAESLSEVRKMIERRRIALRVGGWVKSGITSFSAMIATVVGAIIVLHQWGDTLRGIWADHWGK